MFLEVAAEGILLSHFVSMLVVCCLVQLFFPIIEYIGQSFVGRGVERDRKRTRVPARRPYE